MHALRFQAVAIQLYRLYMSSAEGSCSIYIFFREFLISYESNFISDILIDNLCPLFEHYAFVRFMVRFPQVFLLKFRVPILLWNNRLVSDLGASIEVISEAYTSLLNNVFMIAYVSQVYFQLASAWRCLFYWVFHLYFNAVSVE